MTRRPFANALLPASWRSMDPAAVKILPPPVCVTPCGRVGVFAGVGYRLLSVDVAREFHASLGKAIESAAGRAP